MCVHMCMHVSVIIFNGTSNIFMKRIRCWSTGIESTIFFSKNLPWNKHFLVLKKSLFMRTCKIIIFYQYKIAIIQASLRVFIAIWV